jgi:hypothetical protein
MRNFSALLMPAIIISNMLIESAAFADELTNDSDGSRRAAIVVVAGMIVICIGAIGGIAVTVRTALSEQKNTKWSQKGISDIVGGNSAPEWLETGENISAAGSGGHDGGHI